MFRRYIKCFDLFEEKHELSGIWIHVSETFCILVGYSLCAAGFATVPDLETIPYKVIRKAKTYEIREVEVL